MPNLNLSEKVRKALKIKASFTPFLQINCKKFGYISVKSIKVTEIVKEIMSERTWAKNRIKKMFP